MASINKFKIGLLTIFSLLVTTWAISGTFTKVLGDTPIESETGLPSAISGSPDDYVGAETCKACHEDQFKKFAYTKHAKLKD